jgi:hypothetical protein
MSAFKIIILLFLSVLLANTASAQTTIVPTAVTASGSTSTDPPNRATDSNPDTIWLSGAFDPQWLQLDFGQEQTISKVRLLVAQYPNGQTTHQVYGGATPESLQLLGTLDGVTQDGQWLELSSAASHVRYLRVTTVNSPSWIAWREIQVYSGSSGNPGSGDLRYFGYYASALRDIGIYTSEVADHSNVTWIAGDVLASHYSSLKEAHDLNMGAVLDVFFVFFNDDYTLRSDYQTNWNSYADSIQPYVDNIVAFCPMDEPFWNGRNRSRADLQRDLETVIRTMKQRFPGKPAATIFAYPTVLDTNNFVIPTGYDWVGFDCYPQAAGSFDNCAGQPISWYVNTIKSRLNSNQRMIMVPEGVYFGTDYSSALALQPELVNRADRYYALAQADPVFIGMFTFIYQSQQSEIGNWYGTRDLPSLKEKYRQIGLSITQRIPNTLNPTAVTASGSTSTDPPNRATDSNPDTIWLSGAFGPQWLQLDFGQEQTILKVRLLVAQYPNGQTTHQVYGGATPESLQLLGTLDGVTQDGQWLELSSAASHVRYLRVTTVNSPSWIAWREIQVFR